MVEPTNAMEFWTMVLALVTLALVIVAAFGLRSLRLAQKDMITRATRDGRSCAIARAEEFAEVIIPEMRDILFLLFENKIPPFVDSDDQVRFDPDNKTDLEKAREWVAKLPRELQGKVIAILNRTEAWSIYFTTGLADEKVVYGPCAPLFCRQVVQDYAALLVLRADKSSGNYPNTIRLYKTWLKRLTEEEHKMQLNDILMKSRELQDRGLDQAPLPSVLGLDDV